MLKKLSRYLFIFCSIFFACPVVWSALTEAEQAAVDTYRSTPAERARILERYAEAPEVLRRLRAIDSVQRDLRRTGYGRDLPTPAARHATEPQPFRFDGTGGARRTPAESRALSERYTTLVASHTASGIHSPELGAALIAGTRRRSSGDSELPDAPPEGSPIPSTVRTPVRRNSLDESALRASRGTGRDEDLAGMALRRADALLDPSVHVVDAVTPTINNPLATAAERVRDARATLGREGVPASRRWQEARDALAYSRLITARVVGDADRIARRERQAALARERSEPEPEPLRTVAVTTLPEHQEDVRDEALARVVGARPEILEGTGHPRLAEQVRRAAARRDLSVDSFVETFAPDHGRDEELRSSSTLLPLRRRAAEEFTVGSAMSLRDAVAARERARRMTDGLRTIHARPRRRRTAPAAVTPTPAPKPYVSRALPRHLFTQYTAAEMAQMRRNAKKELDAFRATLRYTRDGERKQPAGPKKRVFTSVMPEDGTVFMRVVPKTTRLVAPETNVTRSTPVRVAPKLTGKNSARSMRSSASSVSFGAGSLDSGRISPADQLRRIAHQQFGHVAKPKGL